MSKFTFPAFAFVSTETVSIRVKVESEKVACDINDAHSMIIVRKFFMLGSNGLLLFVQRD